MGEYRTYKVLKKQVFSTGEFSIVPIRKYDRYQIMKWRNEQIFHLRQNKSLTKEEQDLYFKNVVARLFNQNTPDQLLFSFLKHENCIGYGGLVHINWADKNAEISFIMETALEKEHFTFLWQTYLRLIEKVAFEELKLHKIFTWAFDLRPKLFTSIEDVGFEREAVLNQHVFLEGSFKDVIIHSKIINRPWLREATIFDTELTFKWASNEQVRQYSFNSNPIAFAEHQKWFANKIESKNCYYLILEDTKNKFGSIRFEFDQSENVTISYLIDPVFHGKGYGKLILEMGLNKLQSKGLSNLNIIGFVKSENIASIKIFEKLSFRLTENENNVLKFEKDLIQ